jgi:hypothetical protein
MFRTPQVHFKFCFKILFRYSPLIETKKSIYIYIYISIAMCGKLRRGQSHPCMPLNFCTALKVHSIILIGSLNLQNDK